MSPRRSAVWWAVLLVAGCGAVATAHGLYEVARACGVSPGVAALYVPLTDGLALVAYASTTRLTTGRGYAWCVVMLAAGLSGLAQAVNLAGLGEPDVRLRFGVGYWPAVAVAVAAHLLWLVGRTSGVLTEPADLLTGRALPLHLPSLSTASVEPSREPVVEPAVDSPPEPADEPAPLRLVESRSRARAGAKLRCDCGCGGRVSKATRTRHRAQVRAREAAGT